MKGKILVMGAGGRLGFNAAEAFRDAGWEVKSLVRPGKAAFAPKRTEVVEVTTREAAVEAGQGCDVVLNALNPIISEWKDKALPLAYSAIAAAEANGATLLFPGNVWNFGSGMPPVLDETTPMHPTARKGEMRVEMEQRIQEACDRGMRAIILRAGDFYGSGRGSWFDLVVVKDIKRNNLTYPGPYDAVHEWAYLPDYVATLVKLTAIRNDLPPCATFGFPGHAMTGHELIAAIEAVTNGKFNAKQMNWWMIKTVGRLLTLGRELAEIEYLWRVPHRISGDKLRSVIRDVPHTPINDAIRTSLRELGHKV